MDVDTFVQSLYLSHTLRQLTVTLGPLWRFQKEDGIFRKWARNTKIYMQEFN
jgi:hypothetical protein